MEKLTAFFKGHEKDLFGDLTILGAQIAQAGETFAELTQHLSSHERVSWVGELANKLHAIEHEADCIVGGIFGLLENHSFFQKSFFGQAFEGADLERLISHGDSIIDCLWGAANRIAFIYDLDDPDPELKQIARILLDMTKRVEELFKQITRINSVNHLSSLLKKFHDEENSTDALRDIIWKRRYEQARANPLLTPLWIAWKEVYEHLETAADHCVDVTDVFGKLRRS